MAWYLGEVMPTARKNWTRTVETRVSKTSAMLSQIKAIKMAGLETIFNNAIRSLRKVDIEMSLKYRTWTTLRIATSMYHSWTTCFIPVTKV